jgi:hypothetical protein
VANCNGVPGSVITVFEPVGVWCCDRRALEITIATNRTCKATASPNARPVPCSRGGQTGKVDFVLMAD